LILYDPVNGCADSWTLAGGSTVMVDKEVVFTTVMVEAEDKVINFLSWI
jgi:hypothetical protein